MLLSSVDTAIPAENPRAGTPSPPFASRPRRLNENATTARADLVRAGAVRAVAVVVVVADEDPDDGADDEAGENPNVDILDALRLTDARRSTGPQRRLIPDDARCGRLVREAQARSMRLRRYFRR